MRMHHFGRIVPLMFAISLVCMQAEAQLYLSGGAVLAGNGSSLICLQNLDFINNGSFGWTGSQDRLMFSGAAGNQLSGDSISTLSTVEIAKSNASLVLAQDLHVLGKIQFDSGLIDLNGHILRLSPSGVLMNENDNSRISGSGGGNVTVSVDSVNAPLQLDVGNLGAVLTSPQDLGTLTVSRSQMAAAAGGRQGIDRMYYIAPANNTALDATFRFYYLDAELNGKDANSLVLWKSTDGNSWRLVGADTVDAVNHFVEKKGIDDFSYWTLSDGSNPLPLTLVSFSAVCQSGGNLIQWESGDEQGVQAYVLEKSPDGSGWTNIDTLMVKSGHSGSVYSYQDPAGSEVAYYRIEVISVSGDVTYSPLFSGGCAEVSMPFAVYPNPAIDQAVLRVSVREATKSQVGLFSMTGQLLGTFEWDLQPGVNATDLPGISRLTPGTYIVELLLNGVRFKLKLIRK